MNDSLLSEISEHEVNGKIVIENNGYINGPSLEKSLLYDFSRMKNHDKFMSYKDKAQEELFEQIKVKQRMVLKNPVKRKQQILRTSVTRGILNDKIAKWNSQNN